MEMDIQWTSACLISITALQYNPVSQLWVTEKKTSLLSSFCSVTVKWDLLQHHCCCELELTTQGQGPTRPAVQEHRRHSDAEGPQTHSPSLHLQTHLHGSPGSQENQCQILKILENRQENWRNQSTPWGKCLLGGTAWEKLLPWAQLLLHLLPCTAELRLQQRYLQSAITRTALTSFLMLHFDTGRTSVTVTGLWADPAVTTVKTEQNCTHCSFSMSAPLL